MKGVNKRIIEIEEPENEYIEKVQVFLRQEGNIRVAASQEEARRYASGIVCWKRPAVSPRVKKALLWGGGLLAVAALAVWMVFFL